MAQQNIYSVVVELKHAEGDPIQKTRVHVFAENLTAAWVAAKMMIGDSQVSHCIAIEPIA